MVKRRQQEPTPQQVEKFASGADSDETTKKVKNLRLPLTIDEYNLLSEAAKKTDRSKIGFIRHAFKKLAEELN